MALSNEQIRDFHVLIGAARGGSLVLVETKDKVGDQAAFVAVMLPGKGEEDGRILPLFRCFSPDFENELDPPTPECESVTIDSDSPPAEVEQLDPAEVAAATTVIDSLSQGSKEWHDAQLQGESGGAEGTSAVIDGTIN